MDSSSGSISRGVNKRKSFTVAELSITKCLSTPKSKVAKLPGRTMSEPNSRDDKTPTRQRVTRASGRGAQQHGWTEGQTTSSVLRDQNQSRDDFGPSPSKGKRGKGKGKQRTSVVNGQSPSVKGKTVKGVGRSVGEDDSVKAHGDCGSQSWTISQAGRVVRHTGDAGPLDSHKPQSSVNTSAHNPTLAVRPVRKCKQSLFAAKLVRSSAGPSTSTEFVATRHRKQEQLKQVIDKGRSKKRKGSPVPNGTVSLQKNNSHISRHARTQRGLRTCGKASGEAVVNRRGGRGRGGRLGGRAALGSHPRVVRRPGGDGTSAVVSRNRPSRRTEVAKGRPRATFADTRSQREAIDEGPLRCAVLEAVAKGDSKGLNKLLTEDIPDRGSLCTQGLFLAAEKGCKSVLPCLLSHGADLKAVNSEGKTATHLALENRYMDVAEVLVNSGYDLKIRSKDGNCLLMTAVKFCPYREFLKFLISKGADVHSRDKDRNTPLMVSILRHDLEAIKVLIDNYKIPVLCKEKNKYGDTAAVLAEKEDIFEIYIAFVKCQGAEPVYLLFEALDFHNLEQFEQVLRCSFIDVNAYHPKTLKTPLYYAIERDAYDYPDADLVAAMPSYSMVKALLDHGARLKERNSCERRPFIAAIVRGCLDIVQLLVEQGESVNRRDEMSNNTPLMLAATHDHADVMDYLISQGADMNEKNEYNNTAFSMALEDGCMKAVQTLISHKVDIDRNDSLQWCVQGSDLKSVQLILDNTEPAELPDNLLNMAVAVDSLDVTKVLLAQGAKVNGMSEGIVPLTQIKSKEMTQLLLEHGAEINSKSVLGMGRSALHQAVLEGGGVETMLVLLDQGADLNLLDMDGKSPLLTAIFADKEAEALLLLDKGAEVNLANFRGMTPLIIAAQRGALPVVRALLDKGACINQKCEPSGETALMYATMNNNLDIARVLVEAGAEVNLEDKGGNTALLKANDPDLVTLLVTSGSNVNHRNKVGKTALLLVLDTAVLKTDKLVSTLVQCGANVCCTHEVVGSPLSMLMRSMDRSCPNRATVGCMLSLLRAGAPKMLHPYNCPTPLFKFILLDERLLVREWVCNGGAPINACVDCLERSSCCSELYRQTLRREGKSHVSPLYFALLCGRLAVACYLLANWFMTWADLTTLKTTLTQTPARLMPIQGVEYENFVLEQLTSDPPSLFQLSVTKVLAHLKWGADREAMVQATGLPKTLQDQLLFKTERAAMETGPSETRMWRLETASERLDSDSEDSWQIDDEDFYDSDSLDSLDMYGSDSVHFGLI